MFYFTAIAFKTDTHTHSPDYFNKTDFSMYKVLNKLFKSKGVEMFTLRFHGWVG